MNAPPHRTAKKPAAAGAVPEIWLIRLERPAPNTQIVKGLAPDAQFPIVIEVRNGDGDVIESRQIAVDPASRTFVAGFEHVLSTDNMILAYSVRNGTKHLEKSVIVAPADSAAAAGNAGQNASPARPRTGQQDRTGKAAQASAKADGADAADQNTENTTKAPCDPENNNQGVEVKGVNSGNAHLTGTSLVTDGKISFCVGGQPWKIADPSNPTAMADSLQISGGKFDVILQSPLATNENLLAIAVSTDGGTRATTSFAVKPAIPTDVNPELETVLTPGVTEIKVRATPTVVNGGYEVRVLPCDGVGHLGDPVYKWSTANRFWEVTDANGSATLALDQPLYAGQTVKLCQQIVDTTDASAPPTGAGHPLFAVVVDPLNLGHVRYYFTSGVVMSQDNGFQSGTNAGLFLGLDVDRSWLKLDSHGFRRWNINTYFDARLTSVSTQAIPMMNSGGSNNGTNSSSGMNNSGGGNAASGSISTLDSFNQSRKAASLQAGVYLPLITTRWRRDKFSLFAAPLAKTGFVTLTENSAADTASGTESVTGRFYTFWAYGARLGVYEHFRTRDEAPDLVSYVDVTTGKFGSFEAFRPLTAGETKYGLLPTLELIRIRPWRWSFEGILKIPYSPFVVGFNANVGMGAVRPQSRMLLDGTNALLPFAQPKDDLRFLFGMRFDAAKLLKSLPSLQ